MCDAEAQPSFFFFFFLLGVREKCTKKRTNLVAFKGSKPNRKESAGLVLVKKKTKRKTCRNWC